MFQGSSRYAPWLFAGPAVLAVVVFVYLPMLLTLGFSFSQWNVLRGEISWTGLSNFEAVLDSVDFRTAALNTVIYVGVLVPLKLVIPLALALALLRLRDGIAVRTFRAAYFLPTIVSFSIAGVVWLWMFNPIVGVLNSLLQLVGLDPLRWLNDPDLALWCVIIVAFWKGFGLNLLLYTAALVNVPRDLMEAADIDGASTWYKIRAIQLPLISPTLFFTAITTILIVMDELVGVVDVLTEGGPFNSSSNLVYFLYERAFRQFQFGEASAVSIIITVLVAVVTLLQFRVFEKYVHYH